MFWDPFLPLSSCKGGLSRCLLGKLFHVSWHVMIVIPVLTIVAQWKFTAVPQIPKSNQDAVQFSNLNYFCGFFGRWGKYEYLMLVAFTSDHFEQLVTLKMKANTHTHICIHIERQWLNYRLQNWKQNYKVEIKQNCKSP